MNKNKFKITMIKVNMYTYLGQCGVDITWLNYLLILLCQRQRYFYKGVPNTKLYKKGLS